MGAPKGSSNSKKSGSHLKRSQSFTLASCFRGSPVLSDSEEEAEASGSRRAKRLFSLTWSKTRPMKEAEAEAEAEASGGAAVRRTSSLSLSKARTMKVADAAGGATQDENRRKCFFQSLRKEKASGASQVSTSPLQERRGQESSRKSKSPARTEGKTGRVHQFKSDAQIEPALVYRMRDPSRTGTRTSHPGSPESTRHGPSSRLRNSAKPSAKAKPDRTAGELGPAAGLWVLALALALVLLCGRAVAIICMSICFYLSHCLNLKTKSKVVPMPRDPISRKGEIDLDSEEYKKSVVLKGLLERDGRRLSTSTLLLGRRR